MDYQDYIEYQLLNDARLADFFFAVSDLSEAFVGAVLCADRQTDRQTDRQIDR